MARRWTILTLAAACAANLVVGGFALTSSEDEEAVAAAADDRPDRVAEEEDEEDVVTTTTATSTATTPAPATPGDETATTAQTATPTSAPLDQRVDELEQDVADLEDRVTELEVTTTMPSPPQPAAIAAQFEDRSDPDVYGPDDLVFRVTLTNVGGTATTLPAALEIGFGRPGSISLDAGSAAIRPSLLDASPGLSCRQPTMTVDCDGTGGIAQGAVEWVDIVVNRASCTAPRVGPLGTLIARGSAGADVPIRLEQLVCGSP